MFKEIKKCRICGNTQLQELLNLGEMNLTGVFPKSKSIEITKGPVVLVKCIETETSCGLVQMQHSFDPEEMYGDNYGYRSGLNQSMVKHLQGITERISSIVAIEEGDLVIDIGSNDSTLLRSYPDSGQVFVGIDPTGKKFKEYYPERINLIPNFFSANLVKEKYGSKKAKVITSIAMFYDLEAPLEFVNDIASVLDKKGVWIFEQSYLVSMLRKNAYDTICHEHIEYYALKQIQYLFQKTGLKVVDVQLNESNGGSFIITAAHESSDLEANLLSIQVLENLEIQFGIKEIFPYFNFKQNIEKHKKELLEFIRVAKNEKKLIIAYGASTKGNVILQYLGLTSEDIPYVAEINPDKYGAFTPGTLIPIISENEANEMKPDYKLILPWHFRDSFLQREEEYLKAGGKLIFPLPGLEIVSKK